MSWFDTSKLASIANKAMKEAQKTLDSALEIGEDGEAKMEGGGGVTDGSTALWNSWKKVKPSESETRLTEKISPNQQNPSNWGSFTGSFFEAGEVDVDNQPVSRQPKRSKMEVSVSGTSSSVLGGEEESETCSSSEENKFPGSSLVESETCSSSEENKFTGSSLVVTDTCSMESSSVELVSPGEEGVEDVKENLPTESVAISEESSPTSSSPELKSVDLASSQVSQSSISVISPSSVEVITSSDVELISPESEEGDTRPGLATFPSINEDSVELDSSVSSDRTLVVEGGMQDMLEEAMVEQEKKSESSESSSEIVKVESLPVSEVTSCDELEGCNYSTTNSSDIEVLNSPGGQQGQNKRSGEESLRPCHSRSISDHSTKEEEEGVVELRRRNAELEELLAARESKLVAVSREIVELQEESGEMSMRLQNALEQSKVEKIVSEEMKKTVARLEEEVGAGVQQRTRLEKEIVKMSKSLKKAGGDDEEKDEIIMDLRSEGEALAKQNGKQAEVIRKLRAKEKTQDTELVKLKADAEKNEGELERLSKSLTAKNDVEGSQSEAIKNLTEANQAWEAENRKLKNDLEDNVEKVSGLRSSLEAAYREMAEMKRRLEEAAGEAQAAALSKEISSRQEAVMRLEEERRTWEYERAGLESQVRGLQDSLGLQEQSGLQREEMYRQEVVNMRQRLEQSDTRHEDLAESVGQATKPLLRQIETLQSSLREAVEVQESVEQSLTVRLQQVTSSLAGAQERERCTAEQYRGAASRLAGVEVSLEEERSVRRRLEERTMLMEEQNKKLEELRAREEEKVESVRQSFSEDLAGVKREKEFLSASLEAEKGESESRKRKSLALMEQLKERDRRVRELQTEMEVRLNSCKEDSLASRASIHSSPTPSLSQLSVGGSESWVTHDTSWPEEVFLGGAVGGSTAPSLYESMGRMGANTTSLVENLGAQLKLKEGEIVQLQMELANLDRVRETMTGELTRLTIKSEQIDAQNEEMDKLKAEYSTLQQKYQTMLTMYGEKMEEAEELRLDLQDVKEMYKMQIDQLTGSKKSN